MCVLLYVLFLAVLRIAHPVFGPACNGMKSMKWWRHMLRGRARFWVHYTSSKNRASYLQVNSPVRGFTWRRSTWPRWPLDCIWGGGKIPSSSYPISLINFHKSVFSCRVTVFVRMPRKKRKRNNDMTKHCESLGSKIKCSALNGQGSMLRQDTGIYVVTVRSEQFWSPRSLLTITPALSLDIKWPHSEADDLYPPSTRLKLCATPVTSKNTYHIIYLTKCTDPDWLVTLSPKYTNCISNMSWFYPTAANLCRITVTTTGFNCHWLFRQHCCHQWTLACFSCGTPCSNHLP